MRALSRIPADLEGQSMEFGVYSLDTESFSKFSSWGINREAVLWDH